ncbi:ATP-binding protein, partial [Streptomyces sp. TRM76130]|nr:ATP-binding protein [Streptomyces sp. TRM76130]
ELGVLALCEDQLDRARAELEASVALRGAAADRRGTVAGRRALALVADRSGDTPGPGAAGLLAAGAGAVWTDAAAVGPTAGEEVADARHEESASPPAGVPTPFPPLQPTPRSPTVVTRTAPAAGRSPVGPSRTAGGGVKAFARRNLVAAGASALLVAVLGTVVTLGATSDGDGTAPSDQVGVNPSASQGLDDGGLGADRPEDDAGNGAGEPGAVGIGTTDPGPDGTPGTSDDPTPSGSGTPSDEASGSRAPSEPSDPDDTGDPSATTKPPTSTGPSDSSAPPDIAEPTDTAPSDTIDPTDSESPQETTDPVESSPETSDSASGPTTTSSASTSGPASAPQSSASGTGPGSSPQII